MPSDEMVEKVARDAAKQMFFGLDPIDCHDDSDTYLVTFETAVKHIAAALAAAEAGESVAWSDIASAPKDGTWVLLKGGEPDEDYDFDAPKPPCVVARWVALHPTGGRWYFASYDSGYYGKWFDPTHWRPVAPPPSEASRDERAAIRKEAFEEAAKADLGDITPAMATARDAVLFEFWRAGGPDEASTDEMIDKAYRAMRAAAIRAGEEK